MAERVVAREAIPEDSTYLFTVHDEPADSEVEAMLVRTDGGVAAWLNYCQHWTDVRLDTGDGCLRNGEIRCPKHGATFQPESGVCDFGPCEGAQLNGLNVELRDGDVYLVEEGYGVVGAGGVERDPVDKSTNPGERLGF